MTAHRFRPLRRSLVLNFALAAVLPIAAVSLMVLWHLAGDTAQNVARKNLLLARGVGTQVEVFLREPLAVLQNVRELLLRAQSSDARPILDACVQSSELFESIFLLDGSGRVQAAGLPRELEGLRRDYLGLDLSHSESSRSARGTGRAARSDTFLSLVTGKISLTLSLPAGDRVLVGNFNLGLLSDFTRQEEGGTPVTISIVDRRGAIIAHPDPEMAGRQVSVRDLEPVRAGLAGRPGTYGCVIAGEPHVASVAVVASPGWLAMVSQKKAEAYGPIWRTGEIFAGGAVGAVLLSLVAAAVRSRRISRPIDDLARRAHALAQGDYDFALPQTGPAEVYELAVSLRSMAEAVRDRERSLAESRERYREVIEHLQDVFYRTDAEGRLVMLSPSGVRLLQYGSVDEMLGRNVQEAFCSDPAAWGALLEALGDEGSVDNYEVSLKRRDGTTVLVSTSSHRVQDPEGVCCGIEGTFRDISEHRRLEERLRQAQKMEAIGTLAGGIAHDFNNILQAILGYSELLLGRLPTGTSESESAAQIQRAAFRAADLVRRLLTFSRKGRTEPRLLDLNHEVRQALHLLERTLPKMVAIEVCLASDVRRVKADAGDLEQLVLNLASNARDAMPDGGTLHIETENALVPEEQAEAQGGTAGPNVILRVWDTGKGMDEKTRSQIFDPFYTTKEVGKGTGLGLSTVYGIARAHGGWVECRSAPGRGATFEIYLPASDEVGDGGDVAAPKGALKLHEGGTLLVVDDEAAVRDLAEQGLRARGYKVFTACSGEEALEVYKRHPGGVDVVVLDLGMPGMGGLGCLKGLRESDPDVKVIVTSGYSVDAQAKGVQEGGAVGFVGKPYRIDALAEEIRRVLGTVGQGPRLQ